MWWERRSHPQYPHRPPQISTVRCISSRVSHKLKFSVDATDSRQLQGSRLLKFTFHHFKTVNTLTFSNSVIEVLILAWIGVKWRKDEVYSVCWGGCDQSLEWIKARSSLRSKRSVITPLRIHSGFTFPLTEKTALCSPFKRYQGLLRGKKHVAHSRCSAGTPKIIPASAAVSHWQHSNAARIIYSRVLSREHRAELEFRRGFAVINNTYIPTGSDRMHHICTCFWVLRTHSRALNVCAHRSR